MMAQTGAFMVLSRLPSERCGLSRSLASRDFTKTKRAGLQLAAGRSHLGEIDDLMQQRVGHVLVAPGVMGARLAEQLVESRMSEQLARQTGRTSCTSGMKCRSRFSMPWRSVAVELGQPEQAPRMCRNTMPSR